MQYKSYYVTTLLFFALSLMYGQSSVITGKVLDENQLPVLGASVSLKEISKGTMTDENGNFSLKGNFEGTYTLEISFVGFQTYSEKISIKSSRTEVKDVELKIGYDLEEVTISAKSKIQEIEALAYNVDVVDATKLHNTTLDVGHALDRVSGIRIRENGGVGSRMQLSMNGFRGNQVKVFIDGIPMENFGSSFQLNNLPINLAERVEVFKGVVPVSLGSDALGGAINIVTNTYDENYLDLSYSYGSFNTHRTNVNAVFVDKNDFTIQINAFQNFSDNNYKVTVDAADLKTGEYFRDQKLERFHDQYHNETFIGKFGWVKKSFADQLLFGVTLGQNYKEIQTGARLVAVYGARHTKGNIIMPSLRYVKKDLFTKGLDVKLSANYNLGKERVIDTLNRRYNWFGDFKEEDTPGGELSYTDLEFQNNNGIVVASADYKINEKHAISVSNSFNTFDRKQWNYLNDEAQVYDDPQKSQKNVLGLAYSYVGGDWNATGFLKNYNQLNKFEESYNPTGDYGDVAYRYQEDNFNDFGYGAAATYFFTENLQVKASYEKSFRLALPEEIYGDGGVLLLGNTDLKPETSNNFNVGAGYWFNLGSVKHLVNIDGTVFYRDSKDFIRPTLNNNQVYQVMDNLADATNLGVEAQVRYNYNNRLLVGANVTYQDLRNNTQFEDGQTIESIVYKDRIPNMPYLYGNGNISYNINNVLGKENVLSLDYNLTYVHAFYRYWPSLGGEGKFGIPEQISHDMNASLKVDKFQFTLECRNIFDQKMYDNFSLQKPGRSFTGKIRYVL
ncbi:outer membrane receptor protein involved in Fe transport [Mesonia algae]|uniref:Outer membrane receptor protein involved in Fe transport n=1 Tax=Mesonia algae TaxID=213248 RepID=A0A2W7IFV3_9FLAO|nr:TonB-dependent receptor [Mesonia algae]PZW43995.1 outer membrane receptor protein involved in Fe transport [Mesonia algae]